MAKILIIDDDPLMVRMYQDKFEHDGYEVETAPDGHLGIAKVTNFKPDLILCDMMMPTVDGLTVLKELKDNPETKKIPVIMLTNVSADHPESKKGLELGAVAYLVKGDYKASEIVGKVKEILAGYTHELPKVKVQVKD